MKQQTIAAIFFFLLLTASTPAFALKISPFKTSLTPSPGATTQLFRIENNSADPAAVQISAQTWDILPDGTEINQDAEDQITVFPAQVILKPHESKAVRVQWLSGEVPTVEKSYRIVAEQVPMNLKEMTETGSALRFLLRFKAGFYIAPKEVESDIKVEKIDQGNGSIRLHISNKGTGHTLLKNPALNLVLDNGQTLTVPKEHLEPLSSANIMAGKERYFDIPLQTPAPVRSASIDFEHGF